MEKDKVDRFEVIDKVYKVFEDCEISLDEASSVTQIILTELQKFAHSLCKDSKFEDCRQKYQ